MAACMFATGFHNLGSVVNPQDLAPKHSGSVFGIMNAAGALPGELQARANIFRPSQAG